MKYLKSFNESNSFLTNRDEIVEFLESGILMGQQHDLLDPDYKIHPDGTVDVWGNVRIHNHSMRKYENDARLPVKFGIVEGDFTFGDCFITTLEGSPRSCESFSCRDKSISNLVGGPEIVEDYDISGSRCTSLEGAPREVSGYFYCEDSSLTSLKGAPRRIGRFFDCSDTGVTSFEGGPEEVGEEFVATGVYVTSMEGCPKRCQYMKISSQNPLWNPAGLRDVDCEWGIFGYSDPLWRVLSFFNDTGMDYKGLPDGNKSVIWKRFQESLDYNYIKIGTDNRSIDLFRLKEALAEFNITNPGGIDEDGTIEPALLGSKYWKFVDEVGREVNFYGDSIN